MNPTFALTRVVSSFYCILTGYTEEYDATDGRRKIVLTQPTVWSPHSSPQIRTYQGGDIQQPRESIPVQRTGKPYGVPTSHTPSPSYSPSSSYAPSPSSTPSYKPSTGSRYAPVKPPAPTQSASRTSSRPHFLPPIDFNEGPLAPTYQQPAQAYPARSSTLPRQGQTASVEIPTGHGPPSQPRSYPEYGTFPRKSQPQPMYPKVHQGSVQGHQQSVPQRYSPKPSFSPTPSAKKVIQVPVTNQIQGTPQSSYIDQTKAPPPTRARPSQGVAKPGYTPQGQHTPTRFIPPGTFSPKSGVVHTPASSQQGLLTTIKPNEYGTPGVQHQFVSEPSHAGNKYPGGQVSHTQSPYGVQTTVQAQPGQTTKMPVLTKIQPQPGRMPPQTQPKPAPFVSPKASPKPVYTPLAFKGLTKESTDIVKPMKAETHPGLQHAVVKPPKQQPKVQTIVLPPAMTPGQEVSMNFAVPGLVRGDDTFSQDSGLPTTPSPDVGAQFEPNIIPTREDEEERAMVEEKEDPSRSVTHGFVKSQRKRRDLKAKSEKKQKGEFKVYLIQKQL